MTNRHTLFSMAFAIVMCTLALPTLWAENLEQRGGIQEKKNSGIAQHPDWRATLGNTQKNINKDLHATTNAINEHPWQAHYVKSGVNNNAIFESEKHPIATEKAEKAVEGMRDPYVELLDHRTTVRKIYKYDNALVEHPEKAKDVDQKAVNSWNHDSLRSATKNAYESHRTHDK